MAQLASEPPLKKAYKIVVYGSDDSGKSALIIRFIERDFRGEYDPTIEVSYLTQCVVDDEVALLDVLDTAGQDEYQAMRHHYMRSGEGFLAVYSITSRESFDEIEESVKVIKRVKEKDNVPLVIIANKQDLEHERQVLDKEGEELAAQNNCVFIKMSDDKPIDEAFHAIVREIRKYNNAYRLVLLDKKEKDINSHGTQVKSDVDAGCCSGGCVIF